MNKVYKTVWNALRQCIVVVSEAMSSQARAGKKASKVGLVSTVAAAGMLVGAQAGAQTVQVEALVGLDNTDGQSQTVELPANPTELNALTAEQYNNLIFHTVVAQKGTMNETVTFGNEESTQAFFKDSDRVTQNLGLKALTDFSKVEVTDGHHLVLIGEDSGVQDAESFSILGDGDLYVHGNDGTTETRVSLGALGAKQSKGQLNDIYVGVSPTDIDGSTGTGILEIRNGQYTAKDVYNGAQIIIGEIEDKDYLTSLVDPDADPNDPENYSCYLSNKKQPNCIDLGNGWIRFNINIDKNDRKRAEKIAQDYLYELLSYGDGIVTRENIGVMNDKFAEPFRIAEEKKKQEELRQKELAELKRLKEKYES